MSVQFGVRGLNNGISGPLNLNTMDSNTDLLTFFYYYLSDKLLAAKLNLEIQNLRNPKLIKHNIYVFYIPIDFMI